MAIIAPQVDPQPIPQVREQIAASPETFGGGPGLEAIGQQVQKMSADAGDIAAFEKIRADQTAVQDATAKLSAIHTNLLTNPQTGLPSYQGVNAMQGHDAMWKQYRQAANDISGGLHGQAQVGAFNKIAISMGDAFNQHAMGYVSGQLEKHDASSFKSLVDNQSNMAGISYGNDHALQLAYGTINDATAARAKRLGLDANETQELKRNVQTKFHETVLSQMVNDPNFQSKAKSYFNTYKDEMDTEAQDRIRQLFDAVPRQQKENAKSAQADFYKANMRQAMLDMFDGKLTLSEAQRRFREDHLDKSDYNMLASKLSKPDAAIMDAFLVSKPQTFNAIRQAQLTGSESPGEIQRMIAKGAAAKEITPDDGKYLMSINDEKPPTPRDKYVEAQANNIRDFGSKYFAETNLFGMPTNKDQTSHEAESVVNDFYNAVDKSRAQGEKIDEIRDQIKKGAMQKRFPGLGNLEKAPDVVIDVKGHLTRLLNPDQHSGLKPRYRIVPTGTDKEE